MDPEWGLTEADIRRSIRLMTSSFNSTGRGGDTLGPKKSKKWLRSTPV